MDRLAHRLGHPGELLAQASRQLLPCVPELLEIEIGRDVELKELLRHICGTRRCEQICQLARLGVSPRDRRVRRIGRRFEIPGNDVAGDSKVRIRLSRAPDHEHDTAAGPHGAQHSPGRLQRIGYEHESHPARNAVEGSVAKRQCLARHQRVPQIREAQLPRFVARSEDHLERKVGVDDDSARSHETRNPQRRLAGTAGNVEHPLAGRELCRVDERLGHRREHGPQRGLVQSPIRGGFAPFLCCLVDFGCLHTDPRCEAVEPPEANLWRGETVCYDDRLL